VELLRVCGLRVAFSQAGQRQPASNPWARLGSICHAVFQQAAEGRLGDGGEDFRERFEAAWATAVAEQEQAALASETEAAWGNAERWPSYADKHVRARKRARELARKVHSWADADISVERLLQPEGEILMGRPDLVVRAPPPYRIEDYKTAITHGEAGQPEASYRRQILLYAYLESVVTGRGRPELGIVVPLNGPDIRFIIDWDEVDDTVRLAHSLVDEFNASISQPLTLGQPSPSACAPCPHATICPVFWSHTASFEFSALQAIEGEVLSTHIAQAGTITARLQVTNGTVQAGKALLHRFPLSRFPALRAASAGRRIRAVGLRVLDDEARTITPRGWTRVTVLP